MAQRFSSFFPGFGQSSLDGDDDSVFSRADLSLEMLLEDEKVGEQPKKYSVKLSEVLKKNPHWIKDLLEKMMCSDTQNGLYHEHVHSEEQNEDLQFTQSAQQYKHPLIAAELLSVSFPLLQDYFFKPLDDQQTKHENAHKENEDAQKEESEDEDSSQSFTLKSLKAPCFTQDAPAEEIAQQSQTLAEKKEDDVVETNGLLPKVVSSSTYNSVENGKQSNGYNEDSKLPHITLRNNYLQFTEDVDQSDETYGINNQKLTQISSNGYHESTKQSEEVAGAFLQLNNLLSNETHSENGIQEEQGGQEIVSYMFSFLFRTKKIEPVCGGYFDKVFSGLIDKEGKLFDYMIENGLEKHIDAFVTHANIAGVATALSKFVVEDGVEKDSTSDVFSKQRIQIVRRLHEELLATSEESMFENICTLFCDILRQVSSDFDLRLAPCVVVLAQAQNVQKVLEKIAHIDENAYLEYYVIVLCHLAQLQIKLEDHKNSESPKRLVPSGAKQIFQADVGQNLQLLTVAQWREVLEFFTARFLEVCHNTQPKKTFGSGRIKCIDCIATLANNQQFSESILHSGVLRALLEVVQVHSWHNVLHSLVYKVLLAVFAKGSEQLVAELFTEAQFVLFLTNQVATVLKHPAHLSKTCRGSVRVGSSGFLINCLRLCRDEAHSCAQVREYLGGDTRWSDQLLPFLIEAEEVQKKILADECEILKINQLTVPSPSLVTPQANNPLFKLSFDPLYHGDTDIEGKRHGIGKLTLKNDSVVEGQFLHGQITGHATQTFKDGRVYRGNFLDGKFHGQGEFFWPDGRTFKGIYNNGRRQSGVITFFQQQEEDENAFRAPFLVKYEGGFDSKGRPHGTGLYTDSDNCTKEVAYEHGRRIRIDPK